MDAWATLNLRATDASLFSIFRTFVTDRIVERLVSDFDLLNPSMGRRRSGQNQKRLQIDAKKVWQTFAVYTFLTAKQKVATENRRNGRFMRSSIEEARSYFHSKYGVKSIGREIIEKLIGNMLLSQNYSEEISQNFISILASLGQSVAGDEKLWWFTGNSESIRLVPSKPGKTGLWFYELCCRLRAGGVEIPFLMHLLMHSSTLMRVSVGDVVKLWVACIRLVGRLKVASGLNPNPKCYLCFDSYYESSETRSFLLEKRQYFSASCKTDRVKLEVDRTHNDGVPDLVGQSRTIYNEETKELFTYHYDRQKGVGKKYNLSYGFTHSQLRAKVKSHENFIPGYTHYKTFFEACDNFNRRLHDCHYPHKRGGKGQPGDLGSHHDFLMACIFQNTRNAYFCVTDLDPNSSTFENDMTMLASDMYFYSLTL